jgi:(p)ppGpp synthase/HD superfamily hydrolase
MKEPEPAHAIAEDDGPMAGITNKQLTAMKMHVVDATWGTEGLRAMLKATIASSSETDRATVLRAEGIAARLHAGDLRTGDRPYVNHLLRVAIRVAKYYNVNDRDVLCAALLHDAVEDHPEGLAELASSAERDPGMTEAALAMLAHAFNDRVAGLVRALTNPDMDPSLPLAERDEIYRAHVIESLERDTWARVIKISDFTDNGAGVMWTVTGHRRKRLAAKYAPLVPSMIDFATRPDTPLGPGARRRIVQQMEDAGLYFEIILGED